MMRVLSNYDIWGGASGNRAAAKPSYNALSVSISPSWVQQTLNPVNNMQATGPLTFANPISAYSIDVSSRHLPAEFQMTQFSYQYRQQLKQQPQYSAPVMQAMTPRQEQLFLSYPEPNAAVKNAWLFQANNLPVPRRFKQALNRYEAVIDQKNAYARKQWYLEDMYSYSIGGRVGAALDSAFNLAWRGTGNLDDFAVMAAPFAITAQNAPAQTWSGRRTTGRTDPVFELEVGRAGELSGRSYRDGLTPDHIPSFAAIRANIEAQTGRQLRPEQLKTLYERTYAIVIRTQTHQQASRTYGGRNTSEQVRADSQNLQRAVQLDRAAYRQRLIEQGHSPQAVDEAFRQLDQLNRQEGMY